MQGQKVMILSAGVGNGHNRAAKALEKVCSEDSQIDEVLFVDCLDYTNEAFRDIYSKHYIEAVKKAPTLWDWAFKKTDVPWEENNVRQWFERINARSLIKKIHKFKPTICICTHFMPAIIVSRRVMDDKLRSSLSIVVTDYYVHASWLTDVFCRYFVPHTEGKIQLLSLGFPDERITVSGIPIDPVFALDKNPGQLRQKLNLQGDLPVILLNTGSVGGMNAEDMVDMLSRIKTPCQIAIICGRHKELKGQLEEVTSARTDEFPKFNIQGYTNVMDEWMTVADLLIGKPGGLTLTESLAKGLGMIIWDPIPGQEVYNSVYLLENGAGVAPTSVSTLGYKVDSILQDKNRLEQMKHSALKLANPNAAEKIVETILKNADEPPVKVSKLT